MITYRTEPQLGACVLTVALAAQSSHGKRGESADKLALN